MIRPSQPEADVDPAAGTIAPSVPIDASPTPPARFALRLDEVAAGLGVSRRALERERSAGRFPQPDRHIGRCPLWSPETIRRWVEGGGRA
jgi:predicted DNA-binding transcriptional regulator AlpA